MTTVRKYFGDVHPYRWLALTIWIIVFSVLMFFLVRQNRQAIHGLNDTKASVAQLERTNCALRGFLAAAAKTREEDAQKESDPVKRESDLRAADQYRHLSATFDGRACKVRFP